MHGRALAIAVLALSVAGTAALAEAPAPSPPPASRPQAFDLPAQPLSLALRALGARTNLNLLYEDNDVAGRRSTPVAGVMTREAALATLLHDTGLLFRFAGPDAVLIFRPDRLPDEAASIDDAPGAAHMMLGVLPVRAKPLIGTPDTRAFVSYSERVQMAVGRRLKLDPAIQGRHFVAVLSITVAADGALHLESLAKSTGEAAIDRAITLAVNGAAAPDSPPANMPQPIRFELTGR